MTLDDIISIGTHDHHVGRIVFTAQCYGIRPSAHLVRDWVKSGRVRKYKCRYKQYQTRLHTYVKKQTYWWHNDRGNRSVVLITTTTTASTMHIRCNITTMISLKIMHIICCYKYKCKRRAVTVKLLCQHNQTTKSTVVGICTCFNVQTLLHNVAATLVAIEGLRTGIPAWPWELLHTTIWESVCERDR